MFNKKILAAIALSGAILAPSASFAGKAQPPCILNERSISSVVPYRVYQHVGRGVTTRLAGAQVFVQAEPGLTAQWLELTLVRHIAQMHGTSMKDCAFSVKDVKVEVDPAETGFAVKLIARDASQAEEVLRRARLLHPVA
jgi:hypothetical protein